MSNNFLTESYYAGRQRLLEFVNDLKNVITALGVWSSVFILAEVILGLLSVAGVMTLGLTIDAVIGARGIGVMTTDVTSQLWRWLLILLIGFAAYMFVQRFSGKAAAVGQNIAELIFSVAMFAYFLFAQQYLLVCIYFVLWLAEVFFLRDRRVRLLILSIAILISIYAVKVLIGYTVLRAYTVGEGLALVAAIIVSVISFKLRWLRK